MQFKNLKRRVAAILIAAAAVTSSAALPAHADDGPDYDVVCCIYTAAGTVTVSGGVRYGSDIIAKKYSYWSLDSTNVIHRYDLFIKDKYEWKQIIADGSLFIKVDWAYGSLYRDGFVYAGLTAHHANGQARLFPYLSSAANNVYTWPLDWAGAATQYHQHVWLTYAWQNSDTRWLRETSNYTIKLPAGEKFGGCATPQSEGKTTFTFTTTTSYLR